MIRTACPKCRANFDLDSTALIAQLDEKIERLEDVAARWDVPGGSKRLARRALDKADGLRVARRLLS